MTPALAKPGGKPVAVERGIVPFLQPETPAKPVRRKQPRAAASVSVGERYPNAHVVTEPGRYGLSDAPDDTAYAVIGNTLARIDRKTFKVLSILRSIEGPRD